MPHAATLFARGFALLLLAFALPSCDVPDPAPEVALAQAPPDTASFFQPGIEVGVLYAYITAQVDIFIYRRDLNRFGWVTLPQFRRFIKHAKSMGGYLVYSLEDGDLKQPRCRDAFFVIHNARIDTQDPVDVLPLVMQERRVRKS